MENTILFKSIYGSRLYGTNTPDSDYDYKQIHMNPTDVLLTGKYSSCFNKNTNPNSKNTAEDVDFESKELRHFIKEALSGQTYAIDLLFTPDNMILETSDIWKDIIANRHRLISRNVSPFIGYVRGQAAKYSKKGEKINELDTILSYLENIKKEGIRCTIRDALSDLDINKFTYFSIDNKKTKHSPEKELLSDEDRLGSIDELEKGEDYLYGPDCAFPMSRQFSEVYPILLEKRKTYGKRAEIAAANDGIDLKAYYHALRIVWELEEYLTTSKLVFPCARVNKLRDIRAGKFSKEYIEDWISSETERVLAIPNNLPEADTKFWNDWLLQIYMRQAHVQSTKYLELIGELS